MIVAILGPGSLGQTFAMTLARNQIPVILVGSAERVDGLIQHGIQLSGMDHGHMAIHALPDKFEDVEPGQIMATSYLPGAFPVDSLLVSTKAHQLRKALDRVAESHPDLVLGFQNGITKDEALTEHFGPERVGGAVTIIGADRQEDGSVYISGAGSTFIGPLPSTSHARFHEQAKHIIDALNQSGYPAQWRTDIISVEWAKALMACATFGVAVLIRGTVGDIFSHASWAECFLDLIEEAGTIADALQIPLPDLPGFPVHYYRRESRAVVIAKLKESASGLRTVRVSMLQDLLAGRDLEVDEVFGGLLDYAEKLHVPVPRLAFTYQIIRGFHESRRPT